MKMAAKKQRKNSVGASGLEGRYANFFKIGHNAFEFVFDFGQFYNASTEPQLHTRIITGPSYAKDLLKLLQDSIDQYEQSIGVISDKNDATES
jgi:hypothetical protein